MLLDGIFCVFVNKV